MESMRRSISMIIQDTRGWKQEVDITKIFACVPVSEFSYSLLFENGESHLIFEIERMRIKKELRKLTMRSMH